MVKIYRIEHKSTPTPRKDVKNINMGCYNYTIGFHGDSYMFRQHRSSNGYPNIFTDFEESYFPAMDNWFCAFKSIDSLNKWFGKWVEVMCRQNFVVIEYIVTEAVESISEKQVLFLHSSVVSKRVIKIDTPFSEISFQNKVVPKLVFAEQMRLGSTTFEIGDEYPTYKSSYQKMMTRIKDGIIHESTYTYE